MTLTEYPQIEQGSDKWHDQRRGLVTASVVGKLIASRTLGAIDFDCPSCAEPPGRPCVSKAKKAGEAPAPIKTMHAERSAHAKERAVKVLEPADTDESRGLTALLVAERITGWTDPTYMSDDMYRGHLIEPIARDLYSEKYAPAKEIGFMVRSEPDWTLGYSPDGLIGDGGLLEVKAPRAKTHLRTILSGEVPTYHMPQIQAGLLVTGRKYLDFVSYYGGLPMFVKRVLPDQDWFDAITDACIAFEQTADRMLADYENKTTGFAQTERFIDAIEIRI